jgi:hypothetical protein
LPRGGMPRRLHPTEMTDMHLQRPPTQNRAAEVETMTGIQPVVVLLVAMTVVADMTAVVTVVVGMKAVMAPVVVMGRVVAIPVVDMVWTAEALVTTTTGRDAILRLRESATSIGAVAATVALRTAMGVVIATTPAYPGIVTKAEIGQEVTVVSTVAMVAVDPHMVVGPEVATPLVVTAVPLVEATVVAMVLEGGWIAEASTVTDVVGAVAVAVVVAEAVLASHLDPARRV